MARNSRLFGLFATIILLTASGRVGSSDAGSQLDAAILLVQTGSLRAQLPFGVDPSMWVAAPSGGYFQAHDIGGTIAMLPAACIGRLIGADDITASGASPPSIPTRVMASLTFGLIAAAGCVFVTKTIQLFAAPHVALLFGLIFLAATIVWPYAKTCLDVTGGCAGSAVMLYALTMVAAGSKRLRYYLLIGAGFAFASSFRYSLGPFIGLGLLVTGWLMRSTINKKRTTLAAILAMSLLAPTFLYNLLRTGNMAKPATTAAQFDQNNSLSGNAISGTAGLFFSPNRGLIFFSPLFLLLLGLPFKHKQIPTPLKQVMIGSGIGTMFYIAMIGSLANWGSFGWGPRYLLPVMPQLFIPVAVAMVLLWHRWPIMVSGLVILSLLINASAVLANWQLAAAVPGTTEKWVAYPSQIVRTMNANLVGIFGATRQAKNNEQNEIRPGVSTYPDLLLWRIGERSPTSVVAALVVVLGGATALALLLRELLRDRRISEQKLLPVLAQGIKEAPPNSSSP